MSLRTALSSLSAVCLLMAVSYAAGEPPHTHSPEARDDGAEALEARAARAADAANAASTADNEMTSRAKRAAQAAQSETMHVLMGDMSARIFEALGVEDEAGIEMESSSPPEAHPAAAVLVFASSSIPLQALRRYAADLERTGGAIVLRGAIGGLKEMGPTVDFILKVLKVDPACDGADCDMREVSVIIDPVVFRQAGVARVPAVAIVDSDPFQSYCERASPEARSDPWIVTYGDASLEGHLDELARRGERRASAALAALRKETSTK